MAPTNGIDDLNLSLREMVQRSQSMLPAYREMRPLLVSSIIQNFNEGGRPARWLVSQRARKESGQTLLRKGRLMRSVTTPNVTTEGIEFGSNLPYARIHQEGRDIQFAARSENFRRRRFVRGAKKGKFKKGTDEGRGFTKKAYTVRMPARPYIVFHPEDVAAATRIALDHVLGK